MDQLESLSHSVWECKSHVSFIPKCRRRVLYEGLRQHLGEVFRRLAEQKESRVPEGQLMPDHVHMLLSIPLKYAVSEVVDFIKGKSAIHLARTLWRAQAEFCRATPLGTRLLCVDRWTRRDSDTRIHPQPGGRGQATRPVADVGSSRRKGGHKNVGAASAGEDTSGKTLSCCSFYFDQLN
jgi:putative transposase